MAPLQRDAGGDGTQSSLKVLANPTKLGIPLDSASRHHAAIVAGPQRDDGLRSGSDVSGSTPGDKPGPGLTGY